MKNQVRKTLFNPDGYTYNEVGFNLGARLNKYFKKLYEELSKLGYSERDVTATILDSASREETFTATTRILEEEKVNESRKSNKNSNPSK